MVIVVQLVGRLPFPAAKGLSTTCASSARLICSQEGGHPSRPTQVTHGSLHLRACYVCLHQQRNLQVLLDEPLEDLFVPLSDVAKEQLHLILQDLRSLQRWLYSTNGIGPEIRGFSF